MLIQHELIAGVDEAGRGPLAGPVIAAAVILDPAQKILGLVDSKRLTEKRRESLYEKICDQAIAWAIGRADVAEIDRINILQASLLAMQRAVSALSVMPHHALIDGNRCPELSCTATAIIQGDLLEPVISAASIIAKVVRDREMMQLDKQYPGYGFAEHKGYGTKAHIAALRNLGVSAIHRKTFEPVASLLTHPAF